MEITLPHTLTSSENVLTVFILIGMSFRNTVKNTV